MANPASIVAGEFVLHDLFYEFSLQVKKKIDHLFSDGNPGDAKQIMKSLQRGEDTQFDQLLSALGCVAEHCLPSLLDTLFDWFEEQIPNFKLKSNGKGIRSSLKSKSDTGQKDHDTKKELREMAIAIVFCLVLIEVLQQLPVYPLQENQIQRILSLAFTHFRNAAIVSTEPAMNRAQIVADLFAEILGVMAKTKFQSIRAKFMTELEEAKKNEHNTRIILALIMGMKFFRVKMYPVEDFEASFRFLRELADYSLEVKEREIKHGLASLFVEILVPVAAAVKTEVNVPVLRDFVDTLYPTSLELSKRKKNQLIMYPLVTCLLCVSQKQFFLNNWHIFLDNCLSNLKNRDQKLSRVALESLYRLLWAYTVRIKCESNTDTQSRLQSVIKTLFPVGSRSLVPKDTPLSIYVKIIQFIAQERLDFAMKEIVLDLLCISLSSSRNAKVMTLQPQRMNIGLRAFLVITDCLQQKDGAPPMPTTVGVMPSGNTLRVKKTFLNKMLTEDEARTIGVLIYHKYVQKALDWILLTLDSQVGQRMMMTNVQISKNAADIVATENKAKIDLFHTCIAAMPRLIPAGTLSNTDLFEMLSRLTIHIDEELRSLAFNSLLLFAQDVPEQREDVVATFVSFILKQVTDIHHLLLDTALRHLMQLITGWRNKCTLPHHSTSFTSRHQIGKVSDFHERRNTFSPLINHLQGFALVLLCNNRSVTRKLACLLLREIKALARTLKYNKLDGELCIDVLDRLCPEIANEVIIEQELPHNLSPAECKCVLTVAAKCDITALVECSSSWCQHKGDDVWTLFIASFMKPHRLPAACPSAVEFSWPDVYIRLMQLWQHMDPVPTSKKATSIPSSSDTILSLWTNYLVFACRGAPTTIALMKRHSSSAIPAGTPDWFVTLSRDSERLAATPSALYQKLLQLLRVENNTALRDSAIIGLGSTSVVAFPDLMNELLTVIHEACKSHRPDNMRRKRKRENTRVMLARVMERLARHKVLSENISMSFVLHAEHNNQDKASHQSLSKVLLDYIKDTCAYLESVDKVEVPPSASSGVQTQAPQQLQSFPGTLSSIQSPQLQPGTTNLMDEFRIYFGSMIVYLVKHMPEYPQENFLSHETRRALFFLFGGWCGRYGSTLNDLETFDVEISSSCTLLHVTALKAECAVLCCGPVFDKNGLQEGSGYLYSWLEVLLDSGNPRVHMLGREAVILLLKHNRESSSLLPWVIDKCYTGSCLITIGCFCSIAAAFNYIDLSCYMIPLFNLALFNISNSEVSQAAQHLLAMLQTRISSSSLSEEVISEMDDGANEMASAGISPKNQTLRLCLTFPSERNFLQALYTSSHIDISKNLAKLHPEFTVPILSEIFSRFMLTTLVGQQRMLQYILPWLRNIELSLYDEEDKFMDSSAKQRLFDFPLYMLRSTGWGSPNATFFVLSNLTYITIRCYSVLENEIEKCWNTLCLTWPGNLDVLLLYASALSLCGSVEAVTFTSRRLITYFARAKSKEVAQYLVKECQIAEAPNFGIVVQDQPPFLKIELQDIKAFEKNRLSKLPPKVLRSSQKNLLSSSAPTSSLQVYELSSPHSGRADTNTLFHHSASSKPLALARNAPHHMSLQHLNKKPDLEAASPKQHSLRVTGSVSRTSSGSMFSLPGAASELTSPNSPKSNSNLRKNERETMTNLQLSAKSLSLKSRSGTDKLRPSMHKVLMNGKLKSDPVNISETDISEHPDMFINWRNKCKGGVPHSLPQPSTPLYHLPLHEFLNGQEIRKCNGLLRSNIACLLLSEIVVEHDVVVDWKIYLPTILLSLFLGMDVNYERVAWRCQSLLAHIMIQLLSSKDQALLASSLVSNSADFFFHNVSTELGQSNIGATPSSVLTVDSGIESPTSPLDDDPILRFTDVLESTPFPKTFDSQTVVEYIHKLVERTSGPLWDAEDATPKSATLKSAEQLKEFVCHVVGIVDSLVPDLGLKKKLSKHSLKFAVRSSSKHCASRALQVFRSLNLPLKQKNISELSVCLTECIAEGNDPESQSWAIEILISFLQTCEIYSKRMPTEEPRQRHSDVKRVATTKDSSNAITAITPTGNTDKPTVGNHNSRMVRGHAHRRSGSVSISKQSLEGAQKVPHTMPSIQSNPSLPVQAQCQEKLHCTPSTALNASTNEAVSPDKGVPSLEEWKSGLAQIFWIAVGILESDFDHEYLIALRIIRKILEQLPLNEADGKSRILRSFNQIHWSNFQGLQTLLLKGLSCNTTFEAAFCILSNLTTVTNLPIVSTCSDENGFAMNVIALLPRLVNYFGDPDPFCCECAQNIAQVCVDYFKDHIKLQSLAHVMSLYNNNTYNKSVQTWVNVVCKYVHETFPKALPSQLTFLTEMLDKGHPSIHLACLHVTLGLLSLSTALNDESNANVTHELLHTVSKLLNGKHWREALSILKLAVSRCSQLASPSSTLSLTQGADAGDIIELPGLTLSFKFDLSNTRFARERSPESKEIQSPYSSSWRKPHLSQRRTRERLRSVLSVCTMPKRGDYYDILHPTKIPEYKEVEENNPLTNEISEYSSSQENEDSGSEEKVEDEVQYRVFRDFDFLNEIEEIEGEGTDSFNTGMQWNASPSDGVVSNEGNSCDEPLDECDLTSVVLDISHDEEDEEEEDSDTVSASSQASSVVSNPNLQQSSTECIVVDPDTTPNHAETLSNSLSVNRDLLETSSMLFKSSTNTYIRTISPTPPEMLNAKETIETLPDDASSASSDTESSYSDKSSDDESALNAPSLNWKPPDNSSTNTRSHDALDEPTLRESDSLSSKTNSSSSSPAHEASNVASDVPPEKEVIKPPHELLPRWKTCLTTAIRDSDGSDVLRFFVVFPSLYRTFCRDFSVLCQDGCSCLGTQLSSLSGHFSSMVEDLPNQLECPLCISTQESLHKINNHLQADISYLVEQLESYSQKHDETALCLQSVRVMLNAQEGASDGPNGDDLYLTLEQKQLELCQMLYTLHFILLVVFQTFCKLVCIVTTKLRKSATVTKELTSLHQRLLSEDKGNNVLKLKEKYPDIEEELKSLTFNEAINALNANLQDSDLKLSLLHLHVLKNLWPAEQFGCQTDSFADFLTSIYYHKSTLCGQDREEAICCVIGENTGTLKLCEKLMEVNMQIQNSLQLLEKPIAKPAEPKHQTADKDELKEDNRRDKDGAPTEEKPEDGANYKRTPF